MNKQHSSTDRKGIQVFRATEDEIQAIAKTGFCAKSAYPNSAFFVAKIEGKVIGYVGVDKKSGPVGEILTTYVDPKYSWINVGGVGRKLLSRAKRHLRSLGVQKIFVVATIHSKPFYHKCGFMREPIDGSTANVLWLAKPIPTPKQNQRGTTKRLPPRTLAPQNLLRPEARLRRRAGKR